MYFGSCFPFYSVLILVFACRCEIKHAPLGTGFIPLYIYLYFGLCCSCRCDDPVSKIEQAPLGTVWICTFGGTKLGTTGCRRTYLSIRDLNAHIKYRHKGGQMVKNVEQPEYRIDTGHSKEMVPDPGMYHRPPSEGTLAVPPPGVPPPGMPSSMASSAPPESYRTIPVMSSASRGNLITVQIQDEQSNTTGRQDYQSGFQGPPPTQGSIPSSGAPDFTQPPPNFTPTNQPPPQFSASVPPPQLNAPPGGTNVAPPSMSLPPPRTGGPPPNYSTAQRPPWPGPGSAPVAGGPPPHRAPPPQHPQYY